MVLFQTALPLELPQMKPKRNDEAKGLGMQLKGPLGPGGKGSISELKPAACCPAPSGGPQKPTAPLPSAADHLEEELDLLLSLDAPVREGESILPDLTPGLESERDGDVAQEGKGMASGLPAPPIHLLVFVQTAPPALCPHMSASVSDTDLVVSTDICFYAHIPTSPSRPF